MKKLFITLTCTLIFIPYIISMQDAPQLIITLAPKTTSPKISYGVTKKEFYNNPTKQLYSKYLTREMIKELINNGALLNPSFKKTSPLTHWVKKYHYNGVGNVEYVYDFEYNSWKKNNWQNTIQCLTIITTLLECGAQPTPEFNKKYSDLLQGSIQAKNSNKVKILLQHKPTIIDENDVHNIWRCILKKEHQQFIDLLINKFTTDEINQGLLYCIRHHEYLPEIMQKLIDGGATPSIALPYTIHCMDNNHYYPHIQQNAIDNFTFLCAHGAFDEAALAALQTKEKHFTALVTHIKKNKPIKTPSIKTEQ